MIGGGLSEAIHRCFFGREVFSFITPGHFNCTGVYLQLVSPPQVIAVMELDGSPLGLCASDQLPEAARVAVRHPELLFPE